MYPISHRQPTVTERKLTMKNTLAQLALITSKVNRQNIQLVFAVLALAMLVLGIGAPSDGH